MATPPEDVSVTVDVAVDRDHRDVYAYVRDPENLPVWAPGFARSVRHDGTRWLVETPGGSVEFAFVADGADGVADHRVSGDGIDVVVPLRVHPDGRGARVALTLQLPADASDEQVEQDAAVVRADLERLKQVLEGRPEAASG